jgi:NADH-quinone oxidoreductase subunit L
MSAVLTLLVIGLPWLGALLVVLAGDRRANWQHRLTAGFALASAAAGIGLLFFAEDAAVVTLSLGGAFGDFTLVPDGLAAFLAAVATVIGSLAVIFSADYMRGEAQLGRYYFLMLLFIGSMCGLVLAGSLLLLFIFWEMTALCSYALISFHNDDPKAVAGGIKALVITQIGGLGLLIGVLSARASTGSYEVSALLNNAGTLPSADLSLIAFGFLVAAAAKSAQVPFHTWLPGAMEAPTPVSALIHAATMVNAGVYLLARFYPAFASVPGWTPLVATMGMITALLGALMALTSTDLKRVLAYSTISQLGYMFYAIGVDGVFASQFHLLSHAVFKALLFLGAGAVIHAVGTRDLRQMGGLGRQMPFVRTVFIIGAWALVGLPFANGFWSKELILEAGQLHGLGWMYLVMLAVAGLTALYSFRVVWMVFFGKAATERRVHDAPTAMTLSLGVLAFGTLTTWLLAEPFARLLESSAPLHESEATASILAAVLANPATLLAMGVIVCGLGAWWWRSALTGLADRLSFVTRLARADFGFEWLNRQVVIATHRIAIALRSTQTGHLNWNVVGIVAGLIIVLAVLVLGG